MIAVPHLKSKSGKVLEKPSVSAGVELYHPGKVLPFLAEYFTTGQVLYHPGIEQNPHIS